MLLSARHKVTDEQRWSTIFSRFKGFTLNLDLYNLSLRFSSDNKKIHV